MPSSCKVRTIRSTFAPLGIVTIVFDLVWSCLPFKDIYIQTSVPLMITADMEKRINKALIIRICQVGLKNLGGNLPLKRASKHLIVLESKQVMPPFNKALSGLLLMISLALPAASQGRQEFRVNIPARVYEGNVSRATASSALIDTSTLRGQTGMRSVGADTYRAWIDQSHPQLQASIAKGASNQVLVVKGHWDNSGKVLKKFNIPFEKIGSEDVSRRDLSGVKIIIIDCQGKMDLAGKQKLRDFVMRGGCLLSTDWALDNCIAGAFPNTISWNKGMNKQGTYDDAMVVNPDPVLFNRAVTHAPWKLDIESHLIHINNPQIVKVLAVSETLKRQDPDCIGALAVFFKFGRGSVLHMVGHFENNSPIPVGDMLPDPAPVIGIGLRQALAANFVAAALEGKGL